MNPNENPRFLCPECSRWFTVDPNGGYLQHCPVCCQLLNVLGDCDVCVMDLDKVGEQE